MVLPEFRAALQQQAQRLRRVDVLQDIVDNEDGGGLGTVDLLDLYVPTWLLPERVVLDQQDRERARYRQLHDPELSTDQQQEVGRAHAFDLRRPWVPEARISSSLSPLQALAGGPHIVVIAPPGAGKSTLLRVVALSQIDPQFADPWTSTLEVDTLPPISLRLADYGEALKKDPDLALATALERTAPYAAAAVREGRALLLLDGLDEITALPQRKRVAAAIRELLDAQPGLRCIVTTRPNGAVHLPGLAVYHLELFTEDTAIEYLVRWRACQQRVRGVAVDLAALYDRTRADWKQLRARPSLAELARNPLLLAIIAVCQRSQLPGDRVQFYERALRTLLGTWNLARSDDREGDGPVSLDTQWRAWGELALELRTTCPTGVFPRELLRERLVAKLAECGEGEADGRKLGESLLEAAVLRHGLLRHLGDGDFAFWHPTFGEYLAATAIARDRGPGRLVPLREDPRNVELAAMTLGHVALVLGDRPRATAWLLALARHDDPWGPLRGAGLAFAVACVRSGCAADRSAITALLCLAADRVAAQPLAPGGDALRSLADSRPKFCPGPEGIAALLSLSRTPRTIMAAWVRPAALRLLANVAAADPTAHAACREAAPSYHDPQAMALRGGRECAGYAALGLLRAGEPLSGWLPAILGLEWHTTGGDPVDLSADGLALREALRPHARRLNERLTDADEPVRRAAAFASTLLDAATPAVVDLLFASARSVDDARPLASLLLARLARREPTVAARLVDLALKDPPEAWDTWVRTCLTHALTADGPHCDHVAGLVIDALACELERADGPAHRVLNDLKAGLELRRHLDAAIVREAHTRLTADPGATSLALRCALHVGVSGDPSRQALLFEMLAACMRRGDIAQRFLAHCLTDRGWFHEPSSRAEIADAEVALLAEAATHPRNEPLALAPPWSTLAGRATLHWRSQPDTCGALADSLLSHVEIRLSHTREPCSPYLAPLRAALDAAEPMRSFAAVLLAPHVEEPAEHERLTGMLVALLESPDMGLRRRAAVWLAGRSATASHTVDGPRERLMLGLCAGLSPLGHDEAAPLLAAFGPPDDDLVRALVRESFSVDGIDPAWLFARVETVDLIASYLGHDDNRLHHRAHRLLARGRGRDVITEALHRRGLAAASDDAANLAARLGENLYHHDGPRDPRVTALWRRALGSTHPGVLMRAFDSLLGHVEPDADLLAAADAALSGEFPYCRVRVAWTCVYYHAYSLDRPVDPPALRASLDAFGLPAGRILDALAPLVGSVSALLRAAAAVMTHMLGGPRDRVDELLGPLVHERGALHEHFSLWGPSWDALLLFVEPRGLERYDCVETVADWTLVAQASGLGSRDPLLPDRLLAVLREIHDGRSRRRVWAMRMLLAAEPAAAEQALDEAFARLYPEIGPSADPPHLEPPNDDPDRPRWRSLVEQCHDDERVLRSFVAHALARWPRSDDEWLRQLSQWAGEEGPRERLRPLLAGHLEDSEPQRRGAAARWLCRLGDPGPAELAAWSACWFAESIDPQVFPHPDYLDGDEVAGALRHVCGHPDLWRGAPNRHRRALGLLYQHHGRPPPGGVELVGAALVANDVVLRIDAAYMCRYRRFEVSRDDLAAAERAALVAGCPDVAMAADLLAHTPGDPVAVAALRRALVDGERYEREQVCEALLACPAEHAFVRAQLERRPVPDAGTGRERATRLRLLLRAGAPARAVAAEALDALLDGRIGLDDLLVDPARRGLGASVPWTWPHELGKDLARQPRFVDFDEILAVCLDSEVDVLVARWRRVAAGDACTDEDARAVVALVSVRPDDDPRRLCARGYWFGRLPCDVESRLVLPRLVHPTPRLSEDSTHIAVDRAMVSSENLWRVCMKSVDGADTPLHVNAALCRRLQALLADLFTSEALSRWIFMHDPAWAKDLPSDRVSVNELAFAALDQGVRGGRIDSTFFAKLIDEFPHRRSELEEVSLLCHRQERSS